MRRSLSFLMCILFVLSAFLGCTEKKNSANENIHTEFEGIYVSLVSYSKDSITVEWHNDTDKEAVYGEYYHVEKYDEASGEWESVLTEDFFVNAIGLLLFPHTEQEKTYSLEPFDLSAKGKYRLRSDFSLGDGKTYDTWVEFYTAVNFLHNDYGYWGISRKTVSDCDIAYEIINELKNLKETGKTVPKISEKPLDEAIAGHLVKTGLLWLELGDKIYRIDPDTKEICRVDKHLGKGYLLDASADFITLIYKVWQYHPYDFYRGSYNVATDTLEIKNVYDANSTVDVTVKKVEIADVQDFVEENKIKLELVSKTDQTLNLEFYSQQSSDNFATMESVEVALEAGKPKTVEIAFGGWSKIGYYLTVCADNTRLVIDINHK